MGPYLTNVRLNPRRRYLVTCLVSHYPERAIDVIVGPVGISLAGVSRDQVYDLDIIGIALVSLLLAITPAPSRASRVVTMTSVIGPVLRARLAANVVKVVLKCECKSGRDHWDRGAVI